MKAGEDLSRLQAHDFQDGVSKEHSYSYWRGRELSSTESDKVKQILAACNESGDLEHLVTLASTTNGLVDDEVRMTACMLMAVFHGSDGSYRT